MDTLHDQSVRDLAWVIGAPVLLEATFPSYMGRVVDDAWCSAQLLSCENWLAALDRAPEPLHQFISARPTRRLGHRFETLIQFWLLHKPDTLLIATNLQVQGQGRTLGEYDIIFSDANAEIYHWEAAVKFYLQVDPLAEQYAFIGPGTRDRLDLKTERVFQHQLLLGDTTAGQLALPQGVQLNKTQAYIKGYLFYHGSTIGATAIPGVSALHLQGWWVRHSIEKLPNMSVQSRFIIPPRLRWLATALLAEDTKVMTYETLGTRLDEHFQLSNEAVLVFEMTQMSTGLWREQSRGFVVCKTWPIIDTPDMNGLKESA